MIWIAPSGKDTDNAALEKRLCDADVLDHATSEIAGGSKLGTVKAKMDQLFGVIR